ncbi:hypothetical protein PV325_012424, partial [Microctonus aethiopoides]
MKTIGLLTSKVPSINNSDVSKCPIASNNFWLEKTTSTFPFSSWKELEAGTNYIVSEIKNVKTRFGEKNVVTINGEFTVFLSTRIVTYLLNDREQYELLEDASNNGDLRMHYIGGKYGQ